MSKKETFSINAKVDVHDDDKKWKKNIEQKAIKRVALLHPHWLFLFFFVLTIHCSNFILVDCNSIGKMTKKIAPH